MHTMLELLSDLREPLLLFLGALLAVAGQRALEYERKARVAKRLALAFKEELDAVQFDSNPPEKGKPLHRRIGGYTSQTFDTLFVEMAVTLPEELAVALMRYHWRMNFLRDCHKKLPYLDQWAEFFNEASKARDELLPRLRRYAKFTAWRLMLDKE